VDHARGRAQPAERCVEGWSQTGSGNVESDGGVVVAAWWRRWKGWRGGV
jgi:hypothetical protein